jgi:CHAD domain-containing protein
MRALRRSATATGHRNSAGPGSGIARDCLPGLAQAFKSHAKKFRKEVRKCRKTFSEETIHDSRIQARRLLACLALLETLIPGKLSRKLARRLKRHLDLFDDLRDTQVQLRILGELAHKDRALRRFQKHLDNRERRFRKSIRKRLKEVPDRRLGKCLNEALEAIEENGAQLTAFELCALLLSRIEAAFRRTSRMERAIQPGVPASVHRTRIAFKRFRYMFEEMFPFLPVAPANLKKQMQHYQSRMGDVQDADVMLRVFVKFTREQSLKTTPWKRLRTELFSRREALLRHFLEARHELYDFWPGLRTGRELSPILSSGGQRGQHLWRKS